MTTTPDAPGASRCPYSEVKTPFDAAYFADPYATYRRLHTEGPVHRIKTPEGYDAWLVTRYADVHQLLGDHRLVRHVRHAKGDYYRFPLPVEFSRSLVREDPPVHTRLRRYMNLAFAPKRVRPLRPRIEAVTDELITALGDSGETDLMASLAMPLPITIIAEMLDVSAEEQADFRRWADALVGLDQEELRKGGISMLHCLSRLVELKRKEPSDDIWNDWIRGLKGQEEPLETDELLGLGFMVLLGGYDPTAGVIGSAVLRLLQEPDLAQRLREQPELMPSAVEEFLRLHGASHTAARRFAAEDVEVGGETIPAGSAVFLSLSAANRDPEKFELAEVFRPERSSNRHVSLGQGPHFCAGAELARMEITAVLEAVLHRLPNLRLAVPAEELRLRPGYSIRSLEKLPVTY
ncbi:cytochrome P450 family protein [Streptomyces coeruleorubidus]|uniref:cytochrome P450 family protein n=1 Tax=Streptomyces coeruleorubidus TaxID=116188 RepID=UPI0033DD9EFC